MRKTAVYLVAGLLPALVGSVQAAPVAWTWTYDAASGKAPSDSGSVVNSAGTGVSSLTLVGALTSGSLGGGAYTASTEGSSDISGYFYRSSNSLAALNSDTGYTVEIRFRINDLDSVQTSPGAFVLTVEDGRSSVQRFWSLGAIRDADSNYSVMMMGASSSNAVILPINTTEFHTYRVTVLGNTSTLYMDDNPTAVGSLSDPRIISTNQVRVGDMTSTGGNSNYSLQYLRVYDGGAEAPVPEPGTLSLLALGGLAVLQRRRHHTKQRTP